MFKGVNAGTNLGTDVLGGALAPMAACWLFLEFFNTFVVYSINVGVGLR